LGTAPAPLSRFQATTAGCSSGRAIEISTGIRSAMASTPWQCHTIGLGMERARVSVLLGCPHGALQPSVLHFQSNVTLLQRAQPVCDQEGRVYLHESICGLNDCYLVF